jgi:glycosyltransferase involved in cell wall biosynthesis
VAVSSGVASDVLRITIGLRRKVLTIFNPIPAIPSVLNRPGRAGGNRIVWVGRLDDPKNPGLMLEAFSLLPKDRGFLLNFVGDGKLRSELEQRARELGIAQSVKFLGFQKDPYACMVDADLLVLTSDREGLPSVLVEALYAGLQIVSTDCGQGIYDILLNNRYGTIVPTNDKYSLAKAIELEISKPSDKYAQIAGAERFQPREIARQFLNALHISKS